MLKTYSIIFYAIYVMHQIYKNADMKLSICHSANSETQPILGDFIPLIVYVCVLTLYLYVNPLCPHAYTHAHILTPTNAI